MRQVKATAALRGMKLKDLLASFVERGLKAPPVPVAKLGHSGPTPRIPDGFIVKAMTNAQIEELLLQEDLAKIGRG